MSVIAELRAQGVSISLKGDQVSLKGADEKQVAYVKFHKAVIMAELREEAKHPPPWPSGQTTAMVLAMAYGLEREFTVLIVDEGDAADQARTLCQGLSAAIRDNEFHGRRYLAKHAEQLMSYCQSLLGMATEPVLEGKDLHDAVKSVFADPPSPRVVAEGAVPEAEPVAIDARQPSLEESA
jgi:hypothetical protein